MTSLFMHMSYLFILDLLLLLLFLLHILLLFTSLYPKPPFFFVYKPLTLFSLTSVVTTLCLTLR